MTTAEPVIDRAVKVIIPAVNGAAILINFFQIHPFVKSQTCNLHGLAYLCSPQKTIMKLYNLLIKYRLQLGILLLLVGGVANYYAGFWPAFPAYLIGVILIAGHFFIGPLRLVQTAMEEGDMEAAERVINGIKYPGLLYKPIRSAFYTVKGQLKMMKQDF